MISGIVTWALTASSAIRLTATMVSVAAGGFLGDWMLGHAQRYAPIVPAAVTAIVIVIAAAPLKSRSTWAQATRGLRWLGRR